MKSVEYLYDCVGQQFKDLSYSDALKFKIVHAYSLLDKLRAESRLVEHDTDKHDMIVKRYKDVEKAIRFNNQLLKEIA